ncbi:MAG: hypothetical protein ACK5LC_13190 [Coprobacillaceae bacterium]
MKLKKIVIVLSILVTFCIGGEIQTVDATEITYDKHTTYVDCRNAAYSENSIYEYMSTEFSYTIQGTTFGGSYTFRREKNNFESEWERYTGISGIPNGWSLISDTFVSGIEPMSKMINNDKIVRQLVYKNPNKSTYDMIEIIYVNYSYNKLSRTVGGEVSAQTDFGEIRSSVKLNIECIAGVKTIKSINVLTDGHAANYVDSIYRIDTYRVGTVIDPTLEEIEIIRDVEVNGTIYRMIIKIDT